MLIMYSHDAENSSLVGQKVSLRFSGLNEYVCCSEGKMKIQCAPAF